MNFEHQPYIFPMWIEEIGAQQEEGCTMREARGSTCFKYTTWILAIQWSWTLMSIRMNPFFYSVFLLWLFA
ncbi:hypothetical protein LUZ61_021273 [Rhynchospora tenuis]|uniref:Uncharacterized protein n=1 Tax=Rhynchospora tenuis TaxID=198213 RepID=A0AAD5Z169_9POAL|nr:hypothetical protein LUZ61_021273 [Rhynchospora tenuis]